uniref:Uncharacterized protein LOC104246176 n=1 Tax=Nicotiana sylvestris TaxID=4096 RepID=A0A1U7Y7Y7_NICSY
MLRSVEASAFVITTPAVGIPQVQDRRSGPPIVDAAKVLRSVHLTTRPVRVPDHSLRLPRLDILEETTAPTDPSNFIPLTLEEKTRLYTPWKHVVIVKVFGRKKEENKIYALHDRPWFVLNHFLSVRQWEPKFMASKTKITSSAIWLRMPELPIEFYDVQLLEKLGNKIGKLLTVDTCTSTTTRGRYARLCVEEPLDQLLGYNQRICSYIPPTNSTTTTTTSTKSTNDEWKIVQFPKKFPMKSTATTYVTSLASQFQ